MVTIKIEQTVTYFYDVEVELTNEEILKLTNDELMNLLDESDNECRDPHDADYTLAAIDDEWL